MSSIFDYIGSFNHGSFWFLLGIWLFLFIVAWLLLRRYAELHTRLSQSLKVVLAALPATFFAAVIFLLSDASSTDSSPAAKNQPTIITRISPIILVADSSGAVTFRCAKNTQPAQNETIKDTILVQLPDSTGDTTEGIKVSGIDNNSLQKEAIRCLEQATLADSSEVKTVQYPVPVAYKQAQPVLSVIEQTPSFEETDNLPGKNLALRINASEEPGSVFGILLHGDPKKPLPNADIVVKGTNFWTSTNKDGEFHFDDLPPGLHQFNVNYLGHTIGTIKLNVN
ncbi:MAG: carboxypeptidase-like regulatory domain-containing protein [Balneolaceae bacterium]|nr:carboxypeptidase-like regulatory domain-containing protein [Balneolaceae bacterium]